MGKDHRLVLVCALIGAHGCAPLLDDKRQSGPIEVAPDEGTIFGPVIDDTTIYWMRAENGTADLREVDKSGGPRATLASSFPDTGASPFYLLSDADALFVASETSTAITRVRKTDGGLATIGDPSGAASGIAVDESTLYWIHACKVWSAPKKGGDVSLLVDGNAVTGDCPGRGSVLMDAKVLYFSCGDGSIRAMETATGKLVDLFSKQGCCCSRMRSDGDYLYGLGKDIVYRMPKTGVAAVAFTGGMAVTVDMTDVFVAADGNISRIAKDDFEDNTSFYVDVAEGVTDDLMSDSDYLYYAWNGGVQKSVK